MSEIEHEPELAVLGNGRSLLPGCQILRDGLTLRHTVGATVVPDPQHPRSTAEMARGAGGAGLGAIPRRRQGDMLF